MFLHLLKSKRMLAYIFVSYYKCLSLHSALEYAIAWGFLSILDSFLNPLHLSIKEFLLVLYGSVQTYFSISKHTMNLVLIPEYFSEIVNKLYYFMCI